MLTSKQEAFAVAFASGKSATDAYKAAYNCERMNSETIRRRAYELGMHRAVKARADELRVPVLAVAQYGLFEAMQEAESAMQFAIQCNNPAALVSAIALRAKLSGLLIDRKEIKLGPLDNMSHDDTRNLLAVLDSITGQTIRPATISDSSGRDTQAVPE